MERRSNTSLGGGRGGGRGGGYDGGRGGRGRGGGGYDGGGRGRGGGSRESAGGQYQGGSRESARGYSHGGSRESARGSRESVRGFGSRGGGGSRESFRGRGPPQAENIVAGATKVLTNYVRVQTRVEQIYKYNVQFTPEPPQDAFAYRKNTLTTALKDINPALLEVSIYDGAAELKTLCEIEPHQTQLSVTDRNNQNVMILLQSTGTFDAGGSNEFISFLNTMMRRNMDTLKFVQMARASFDMSKQLGDVGVGGNSNDGVRIYEGIQTAINSHKAGVLMMIDRLCKIVRLVTCREMMHGKDVNGMINTVLGAIVMTDYNSKTYKVSGVDFKKTPLSTFMKGSQEMSYQQYYYQVYSKRIQDLTQPLIVVEPSARERRAGRNEKIYLIPELCRLTGFADEMKNDYKFMNEVGKLTRQDPTARVNHLRSFIRRINTHPTIKHKLDTIGIKYSNDLFEVPAYQLPVPTLILPNVQQQIPRANFAPLMTSKIINPNNLPVKILFYYGVAPNEAKEFEMSLIRKLTTLGYTPMFNSTEFRGVKSVVGDKSCSCYLFLIRSAERTTYEAIKGHCLKNIQMVSQVVVRRTIMGKNADSAAWKIAYQIGAKVFADIWKIGFQRQPPGPHSSNTMVIGFDVFHDTVKRTHSVGGFVASTNPTFTRWFTIANFHAATKELSDFFKVNLGRALKTYYEKNKHEPSRIIFYRDGVGEGNIEHVKQLEISGLAAAIRERSVKIPLIFIIVSKRVNARLFTTPDNRNFENVNQGTIVADGITRPKRKDFYLTSQRVTQGTVTPTLYDVIQDEADTDAGSLYELTYHLCHLYYNWQGAIKVPAPCQYAHKIAYMLGNHLHTDHIPDPMTTKLWYI